MDAGNTIAVAHLVSELGGVDGRKRLQKIVHLLKAAHPREFSYDFVLYYYGPFSRELATDLDFLCKAELVREISPPNPQADNTYQYKVDAAKVELVRNLASHGSGRASVKPPWSELAATLNKKETPFLEAVSTVVYLAGIGHKGPGLQTAFKQAKPNLSKHFVTARDYATAQNLMR